MSYSTNEIQTLAETRKELDRTGWPQHIARMNLLQAADAPFDEIMAIATSHLRAKVVPEKPVSAIDPPPFTGKGSGNGPWQKFALEMSDMDPEVISSMGREDIITILKDKGILAS